MWQMHRREQTDGTGCKVGRQAHQRWVDKWKMRFKDGALERFGPMTETDPSGRCLWNGAIGLARTRCPSIVEMHFDTTPSDVMEAMLALPQLQDVDAKELNGTR